MVNDNRPDVTLVMGRFGTGGVERVACHLANGFADAGLRTEIAVAREVGLTRGLVRDGVGIVELVDSKAVAPGRALALLRAVPRLALYLKKRRPKVLLSPGNHTHVAAALAHRLSGGEGRLVLKLTNPILKARHGPLRRAVRKWLYRRVFERCDRILVLSPHGIAQVAEINPNAATRTHFVHNPYIDSRALEARTPAPTVPAPGATPMVLAVGRLTKQKNYQMLLRAMARLVDLPWTLLFLGEGPQRQALEEQARKLGIADRVRFEGFVKDPAPFYAQAHLLALSSKWEDLPAVVLEALASGCPVVATACSDAVVSILREAGSDGLVPLDDEAGFAEAVARALSSNVERRPFAAAAAYGIQAGVDEHLATLRPLLTPRADSQNRSSARR